MCNPLSETLGSVSKGTAAAEAQMKVQTSGWWMTGNIKKWNSINHKYCDVPCSENTMFEKDQTEG